MKLVNQSPTRWEYQLQQQELHLLRGLIQSFPFTAVTPVNISRTDQEPETLEKEKLLNEALREHRKELKQLAKRLCGPEKFTSQPTGWRMTLTGEEREILLQILNDIRVECWRALGRPEPLEAIQEPSEKNLAFRQLMDLAGYFEQSLIQNDDLCA